MSHVFQEKTAAPRIARLLGLAMRRAGRSLRNYGRNISGRALSDAEKGLQRVVSEWDAAKDPLTRNVLDARKILSSADKRVKYLSGRMKRNVADANKYRDLAKKKLLSPTELVDDVLSARNAENGAVEAFNNLLKRFPDPNLRPSKTFDRARKAVSDAKAVSKAKIRDAAVEMADRSNKQVSRISAREASRKAELQKAMNKALSDKSVASDAVAKATREMSEAASEAAKRKGSMEKAVENARKASRAARVSTAVYGGGGIGGLGIGTLMSLNKESEHRDPSMRAMAEGLASYMEEACRR